MKILALDAATEACSAALLVDGAVSERYEVIGRGHAGRLLPMADELLCESRVAPRELDGIAFGRGPGGFTGLRIAAGVAQGLAAGAARPVLPVSNLAAVAAGCCRESGAPFVLACLDARMGEVYWAAFDCRHGVPALLGEENLGPPGGVALPPGGPWHGAGHGFAAWPDVALRLSISAVEADRLPRASDIARIAAVDLAAGRGVPPAKGLPVYLRDDVVHRR